MTATFLINPWIAFLRQYGPIPRNDNMYDESIQRVLRRARVQPVEFPAPHLPHLLENFRGPSPDSVILTGTAGDGKTFLCRRVWIEMGGKEDDWERDDKIRRLPLPGGKTLTVIKDLSELTDEDRDILPRMAEAVFAGGGDVFLVAANDGQLVEAWNATADSPSVRQIRSLVEDLLVAKESKREGTPLRLYNLSCTSAADLLDAILDAVTAHPGWEKCAGCRGQLEGRENRCPIWENHERLRSAMFRERLRSLLRLCDQNEYHLPIRQLLLLTSNLLLGHRDAKDGLLRCADVPSVAEAGTAHLASPYSNIFGENLTASRRESTEVFEVLSRFGIGEETNTGIDNLLIYGADDESIRPTFESLVRSDPDYGATDRFLTLQSAYLEGQEPEGSAEFLRALRMQRQRLFFTVPPDQAGAIDLWDLTVFHFAGEYLDDLFAALRQNRKAPKSVLYRLVQGMNRIFTGMLTSMSKQIVLATSGSYSQARVSRIEEAFVEVEPKLGQKVTLELRDDRIHIVVYFATATAVSLPLHLVRYEFLSRVAEGALPRSFSRECYEDLLAFKSRLLREYHLVQRQYGENGEDGDLNLKLLQLDGRGVVHSRAIELTS